jgi:threonine synthase
MERNMTDKAFQQCINPDCARTFDIPEVHSRCPHCGDLIDVRYDWSRIKLPRRLSEFERRLGDRRNPLNFSGVWRFRELIDFAPPDAVVTIGEGRTLLCEAPKVAQYAGMKPDRLFLQYEGFNPSGSFKDNGMTAAFTHGRMAGRRIAACASTGNTSASLALFAAQSGLMRAIVFVGGGKIAFGKLAQALEHGALTLQIDGDFDDAMARIQEVCTEKGIYLVNSLNPFRLEGQKTIMYRILEGLDWEVPDWVVCPGGNLGNSSAFGKAFMELVELGLIKRALRIAVINSTGARTLYRIVAEKKITWNGGRVDDEAIAEDYRLMDERGDRAHTVASAIEINRPVNLKKCLRALDATDGLVREVPDEDILDAKARIGSGGLGCEPASAASVAGLKLLVREQVISPGDRVACVLTGHALKDPDVTVGYHSLSLDEFRAKYAGKFDVSRLAFQNRPVKVPNDLGAILKTLEEYA